jgi:DNA recombination-dependent growth factor C
MRNLLRAGAVLGRLRFMLASAPPRRVWWSGAARFRQQTPHPAKAPPPMGLINGSITYKKYRTADDLPKDFRESAGRNLAKHSFREIDPKKNPEMSIGWVNPLNPTDSNLSLEKVLMGKYVVLGMRRDKKSLPAAILKAQVSDAIRATLRERRAKKLPREEMAGLRETVKERLLAQVSATIALYEAVWDYEAGEVYFSSQAQKAAIEFADLFEETFGIPLEDVNLVTRAEAYIHDKGLDVELSTLERSHFGS